MLNYPNKIRTLRENKKLTQEYMAINLDISQRAYSSIESGKTPLTIERLYDISKLLDTSVSEILDLDNGYAYHNNFNNSGIKNSGSLINFNQNDLEEIKLLYERIIKTKDEEINFLRSKLVHS